MIPEHYKIKDYQCPKSIGHPWGDHKTATSWRNQGPNGDICCAFCGSLHPIQFMELVNHILETKCVDGVYFSAGKPGKVYLNRPGVRNADDGAVKFYGNHLFVIPEFIEVTETGKRIRKKIADKIEEALKLSNHHFENVVMTKVRVKVFEEKAKRNKN